MQDGGSEASSQPGLAFPAFRVLSLDLLLELNGFRDTQDLLTISPAFKNAWGSLKPK